MEYVNLGDAATYINGYAFKPEQRGKKGLPIIRIQDLNGKSNDLGFFDGKYPEQVEINTGDILISWSGSLGVYKWKKGKALLNQHIFKVLFNKIEIDKEYFCYAVRNSLSAMSQQTHGATMKHITKKDFDNVLIPYPDLNVQRQIANNLETVNELIESYEKELILLEQLIKARFVEMFENDNYPIEKLGEICEKITDGTHKTPTYLEEGITFISAKNIVNGELDFTDIKYISEEAYQEIQKRCQTSLYDILLSKSGSLGYPVIVKTKEKLGLFESLAVLKYDREKILPEFLCEQLKTNRIQRQFYTGTKGVAIKHLHLGVIANTGVIVPPLDSQKTFADFVKQVDKSRFDIKKSIIELEREVVYD